ncbi:hypothetical protein ACJZ2D_003332 [Fusarium nematophilum]
MPMLYGEGEKAFTRLQEEIIRSTPDLSILAWTDRDELPDDKKNRCCGFLAGSSRLIYHCSRVFLTRAALLEQCGMMVTNKGIQVTAPEYRYSADSNGRRRYSLNLNCARRGRTGGLSHLPVPMRLVPFLPEAHDLRTMTLLTKGPRMPPDLSMSEAIRWKNDVVPANWVTGVQVELAGSLKLTQIRSAAPRKYWDLLDCIFFSTRELAMGWGALLLDCGSLFAFVWEEFSSTFQGALLDTNSEVGRLLKRELLLPAEQLNYKYSDVVGLLPVDLGRQGFVELDRRPSVVSFKARSTRDESVCRGRTWKVEIKQGREALLNPAPTREDNLDSTERRDARDRS